MQTISDILDRYFLTTFRWLALGVCIAVALDLIAFWRHWEVRLPAWGLMPTRLETLIARLVLFWAVAVPVFGAALLDLLKVHARVHRR